MNFNWRAFLLTWGVMAIIISVAMLISMPSSPWTQQLPGAGPNLKASVWVTPGEAQAAQAQARGKNVPAEAPAVTVTAKVPPVGVVYGEPTEKLVVETLKAQDGTVLYCVHWQPCQRCEFHCLR